MRKESRVGIETVWRNGWIFDFNRRYTFYKRLHGATAYAAPPLPLFGAYFRSWMFCACAGIAVAISARALLGHHEYAPLLPYQLLVYAAIAIITGLLVWLFWFGF